MCPNWRPGLHGPNLFIDGPIVEFQAYLVYSQKRLGGKADC